MTGRRYGYSNCRRIGNVAADLLVSLVTSFASETLDMFIMDNSCRSYFAQVKHVLVSLPHLKFLRLRRSGSSSVDGRYEG